ncbi:MAG: DNA (cytosine-5-)-methyltransferase [Thermoprotei archaeon]|nr:MAG: DNA (cytosine-5-)-methyltransferase [Thermoprotei archaeon]
MYTVIDLFCGAGGFSRGFEMEGFEVVLGIDNSPQVVETYSKNFREALVLELDIKEITGRDIIHELGYSPDIVIGGPPCEAFTKTNPQRMSNPIDRLYVDPLGQLTLHFIRIVGELKPKIFVMENVPSIVEGDLKQALKKEFARVGYKEIYFNILRAEDYGNPSLRRRIFISNVKIKPAKEKRKVTVMDAIGDLPEPGAVAEIPNHVYVPLSAKKQRKISKLKWGQALVIYYGAEGRKYRNFIKLHPYRPAPTVMGSSRFIHPFKDRILTVREQARLMGFPDYHIFYGGRDSQYNQVGEAVPVPLARVIAREILKRLENL